ncbi:MAG: MFS transporter [Candidatus Methanofastidiosia archaeon]
MNPLREAFDFFKVYKNVLVVCIGIFISMIGFGLIFPLFPLYAKTFGATPTDIGIIASMFALTRFIFATPFGALSDRYGRKSMLIVGFFSYSIAMSSFAFAQNLAHLYLFRALQGIASAMVWPSATAIVADSVEQKDRGKAMGYFSMSLHMALIFGPAVGGFLADLYGIKIPFLLCGLIMLLLVPFIKIYVKETVKIGESVVTQKLSLKKKLRNDYLEIKSSKYFKTLSGLMFASFLGIFAFTLIEPLIPIYADEKVGATKTDIGIAFTVMGVVGTLIRPFAGSLADRIGRKKPIIYGSMFSALTTYPMALIRTPAEMIGILGVRTVGWATSEPATQALLADVVDENKRGKIFGLFGTIQSLGMILGPTLGGILYQGVGGEASFIVVSTIALLPVLVLYKMIEE